MNQEIEQRIVAMYFDNKDFEKNAKETIKTLGDLRDNLNLEDSVKGFEELDKAGKKLKLCTNEWRRQSNQRDEEFARRIPECAEQGIYNRHGSSPVP